MCRVAVRGSALIAAGAVLIEIAREHAVPEGRLQGRTVFRERRERSSRPSVPVVPKDRLSSSAVGLRVLPVIRERPSRPNAALLISLSQRFRCGVPRSGATPHRATSRPLTHTEPRMAVCSLRRRALPRRGATQRKHQDPNVSVIRKSVRTRPRVSPFPSGLVAERPAAAWPTPKRTAVQKTPPSGGAETSACGTHLSM